MHRAPDLDAHAPGSGDPWTRHMRRGEFEAALALSDAVLRARAGVPCWHLPRHEQHVWTGAPLDGKRVLVRCYHGLGDTLQFIRYAPLLRAVASEVTVWAQPAVLPLVAGVRGVDRALPLHDGTPDAEYDEDVESMELPHVFRTTMGTLPAEVPYLHADPAPVGRDGNLAVGIAWQAGEWDERRSVPFDLLAPLGSLPGVALHVLQHRPTAAGWDGRSGIVPPSDRVYDIARVVQALDLVVTIDSMPAHLAGALGRPVWTLLPYDADWRWMERRDDSPWYPTMRLFRQERRGEWAPVVRRVAAELSRLTAGATG
jgi:hypothetical protein